MWSKVLGCGKIGIDKNAFHNNKTSINIDEVEINIIVLFDKTSYGNKGSFKHYIGYRHKDGTFSPLNIKLSQLTGYTKHFNNGDRLINFLVADKEMLKKYNKIWDKIKSLFKKEFDTNPIYINKYISAKIDAYNGTEFENRVLKDNKHCNISIEPKNGICYKYLSIILLDSILIYPDSHCSNKHHPHIFFKKIIYAKDKEAALLGKYIYY